MVKLTLENITSKLGKRVDLNSTVELNLSKMQLDDLGSFAKMPNLEKVDLSGNWFRFQREIEKLFDAPSLQEVDFTGCPVIKTENYRLFVISKGANLRVVDKIPVTDNERELAKKLASGENPLKDAEEELSKEEQAKKAKERDLQLQLDKEEREKLLRAKQQQIEEEQNRKARDRELFNQKKAELFTESSEQEDKGPFASQENEKEESLFGDVDEALKVKAEEEKKKREEEERKEKELLEKQKKENEEKKKRLEAEAARKEKEAKAKEILFAPAEEEKQVFVDARSNLKISDRFSSLAVDDTPKKVEPEVKRNVLSEESLFGDSKPIQFSRDKLDESLFSQDDDLFKKLNSKPTAATKAPAKTIKIEEDLFSFSSKPSTTKASNFDDLFSMVDDKKNGKADLSSGDFNFDDYIAQQSKKSSGGLFD